MKIKRYSHYECFDKLVLSPVDVCFNPGDVVFVTDLTYNGVQITCDKTEMFILNDEFEKHFKEIEEVKENKNAAESGKKELVNHPKHYGGDSEYECIKVLKAWLPDEQYKGFLRGNALKYLCRVGNKDESVQELKKAKWYLEKLIEVCE